MEKEKIRMHLLPKALVEERRMKSLNKLSAKFLVAGVLYIITFHILHYFFFLQNGNIMSGGPLFLVALPGCILLTIAFFGFVSASKNTVMELTPLEKELL